ncbi:hydantoinase/oxoprolinase family protein [Rhizorhabdus wittichii]|uniref:Hydantoinase/oxoprolinase family protein n=1 Tax=Rhizorhabdus wittichii TaxID=160791 RepID=A0A975D7X4_9SPHN|nr:hydantoinase/oxoprolinase family protein [Rhizorhabdus wittichii]QTH23936.1 hydantoinase/oxoprolinase family protein [Rhizorhabdus wittichii]
MSDAHFRIGIDVGGTNTDVVLMDGRTVLGSAKHFTTPDVKSGVVNAVRTVLDTTGIPIGSVRAVMIGTTQFVNAFIERRGLEPVAAIRIALPKGDGVPPFSGWPADAIEAVRGEIYMVGGGLLYTGQEYAPLDVDAIRAAARDARAKNIRSFAISGGFSPLCPQIEERARAIVRDHVPDAFVTLSTELGGLGLLDRENAAIINASLAALASRIVPALDRAIGELGIKAPMYLSQNDGTLITADRAMALPILTCAAGPTNSIRGAAFLTGLTEAIVADIGGTTTDIGFLARGFPRETATANHIGGVRTNFRMPDLLSIGIGGGSIISEEGGGTVVGPTSVGHRLPAEGLVFGGATLTATDIAVRAGHAEIGDPGLVAHLPPSLVDAAVETIHLRIEEAIDQIKTNAAPMPLVLVGGGHILVNRPLNGVSKVVRPDHAAVANAVGAAIALASGRIDKMYDVKTLGRDAVIKLATGEAIAAAVEAGAQADAVDVIELVELPMTHMQDGAVQVKVRAVGPIAAFA